LIIAARGIRTFAQSSVGVIMALYLNELGFSILQIGVFLSVGVAGVAFFAFIVGLVAGRVERRRLLVTFSLLSTAAGIGLFFIDDFVILVAIAFAGALSTVGGGGGESPAQPLEIASLPDTAPPEKRSDLFAIYSIVARTGTAIGALAAGLPVLYQDAFGLSTLS
jgi:MFS family permease